MVSCNPQHLDSETMVEFHIYTYIFFQEPLQRNQGYGVVQSEEAGLRHLRCPAREGQEPLQGGRLGLLEVGVLSIFSSRLKSSPS